MRCVALEAVIQIINVREDLSAGQKYVNEKAVERSTAFFLSGETEAGR